MTKTNDIESRIAAAEARAEEAAAAAEKAAEAARAAEDAKKAARAERDKARFEARRLREQQADAEARQYLIDNFIPSDTPDGITDLIYEIAYREHHSDGHDGIKNAFGDIAEDILRAYEIGRANR